MKVKQHWDTFVVLITNELLACVKLYADCSFTNVVLHLTIEFSDAGDWLGHSKCTHERMRDLILYRQGT